MTADRRTASAVALLAPLLCFAAATPAAAFKVGESADFKGCYIWFNDRGEPLRSSAGREIGRKAPCAVGTHSRDTYEVLFGEAADTLVIRDATHHVECVLKLAPGSATVMVPKVCQSWNGE